MVQEWCYLLLSLSSIVLSGSNAVPHQHFQKEWQTEDEAAINKTWMLFPDADGNLYNISLKYSNSNIFQHGLHNASMEVSFWLYTRTNRVEPQNLDPNDENSISRSNFNKNDSTKFLIHGWRNNRNSIMNKRLVNAFLDIANVNVIVVDWGQIAKNFNYFGVRGELSYVGGQVANMINALAKTGGARLDQMHLIGHSLGAHVAGYAGSAIQGGNILAITGLDPALPLFSIKDPLNRLDSSDATYVEIIHTDAGRLGFALPLGHVDFYPNRGTKQPGCGVDMAGVCGHSRAYEYFEESLMYDDGFTGKPCISYNEVKLGVCSAEGETLRMGGKNPKPGFRGQYLVKLRAKAPYGKTEENNLYQFD